MLKRNTLFYSFNHNSKNTSSIYCLFLLIFPIIYNDRNMSNRAYNSTFVSCYTSYIAKIFKWQIRHNVKSYYCHLSPNVLKKYCDNTFCQCENECVSFFKLQNVYFLLIILDDILSFVYSIHKDRIQIWIKNKKFNNLRQSSDNQLTLLHAKPQYDKHTEHEIVISFIRYV